MVVDTFEILKVLPFITYNSKESLDYRMGYNQAVGDMIKIIRNLEDSRKDVEQLKSLCPIWKDLNGDKS